MKFMHARVKINDFSVYQKSGRRNYSVSNFLSYDNTVIIKLWVLKLICRIFFPQSVYCLAGGDNVVLLVGTVFK